MAPPRPNAVAGSSIVDFAGALSFGSSLLNHKRVWVSSSNLISYTRAGWHAYRACASRHHAWSNLPESMTALPAKSFCSRRSTRRPKSFHASVKRPVFVAITPCRSSLTEIDRAWGVGLRRPTTCRWMPIAHLPPRQCRWASMVTVAGPSVSIHVIGCQ